jgi:integrase
MAFRHTASTMLNELEYPADAIELQMAHVTQNIVRSTYNTAELMPVRTIMIREWAIFIDGLINNN